jgi:aryl-alcohol dehydrogenase-like predicted oxidoreductase
MLIIKFNITLLFFLTGKYTRKSAAGLKTESRGLPVAKHSEIEKNWKILEKVTVISKEIGRAPVQVFIVFNILY